MTGIRAIIGLGNPGAQFTRTRHNIGFRVVDALADHFGVTFRDADLMEYALAVVSAKGLASSVLLVKPQTFMNSSGKVVPFLAKKGIKPSEILVVHDELEKSLGSLAIRQGGSARGHNGLRSLIDVMGPDFWRLRFGIARPADRDTVPDYVLSNFTPSEEQIVERAIEQAVALITSGEEK